MALPIGRTTSRGILPDRDYHLHDFHAPGSLFPHPHKLHHRIPPESCSQIENQLYTYYLSDRSIVHTTHPNFHKLFVSMERQLNYHVDHVNNFLHPIPHRINSAHTHSNQVTPIPSNIINYESSANENFLHSPTSVCLQQQDVIAIEIQSNQIYNKNIELPIFSNNDSRPFIHCITKKTFPLTTRLLFPNTSLPPTLLSSASPIMPIFKNRLHRTNTLRKLFKDIQIGDLTYANAQILHQRVSSMALKPILPGYHLDDAISLENMKHDLFTIVAHLEDEIKMDKTITPEDKARKDKVFVEIVEIARSFQPDEMILDINFPVNGLLGLSHPEAVTLLQNYYDAHGITKTP